MVLGERTKGRVVETAFCRVIEVIKEDGVDDLLDRDLLDLLCIVERECHGGDLCSVWSRDIHALVVAAASWRRERERRERVCVCVCREESEDSKGTFAGE